MEIARRGGSCWLFIYFCYFACALEKIQSIWNIMIIIIIIRKSIMLHTQMVVLNCYYYFAILCIVCTQNCNNNMLSFLSSLALFRSPFFAFFHACVKICNVKVSMRHGWWSVTLWAAAATAVEKKIVWRWLNLQLDGMRFKCEQFNLMEFFSLFRMPSLLSCI